MTPPPASSAAGPAAAVAVAVTGVGAVTGFAGTAGEPGSAAFWAGACSGTTSIAAITDGEPFDFAPHRTGLASRVGGKAFHRFLGRAERFACTAAIEAVGQAFGGREAKGPGHSGTRIPLPRGSGVFFGSSTGALLGTEQVFDALLAGRRPLGIRRLASQQHNGPGDAVARVLGVHGPVITLSSACASSTMAIAAALDAIRDGEIEVAIAGGADELCQLTYAGFNSLRAVDPRPTRPFRADRNGLSLGEGCGVLVLESLHHARARHAPILALLAGAAATCDAHHMSAPREDGAGAAAAMRAALLDAGLAPDDIDFLNVHGTGTGKNDAAEWRAICDVFGPRSTSLPLVATKGVVGHLLGASGGIEAVATVLSLHHERLHPTPGAGDPDPALPVRLVVDRPLDLPGVRAGLSTNLAFGGANAALLFRAARFAGREGAGR